LPDSRAARTANPVVLTLAVVAFVACTGLLIYQLRTYSTAVGYDLRLNSKIIETDDGRRLLWARGEHSIEQGEWFDISNSPLNPTGYQYGIGKDTIPAIDEPKFAAIDDRDALAESGLDDRTMVIGYEDGGEAKAYPISILNAHELVNDVVAGKPITVGW